MYGQTIERIGQGEHHMEIRDRQQLRLAGLYPVLSVFALAFRAVAVSTGIIADADIPTAVAGIDMPT